MEQINYLYDGILLADKEADETSYDVVRKCKRILGIKKVGHSGTLDPFATGLMIILLGQGTKLSGYIMAGEKRYIATLRLGVETDTLDTTGCVVRTGPIPDVGTEEIKKQIRKFIGNIEQVPPAFSAVNYKGKRAYKLARKGITVELKKRTVFISSIEIVSIDFPEITIDVRCSGGTYIRSLAADIGEKLGSVAHLTSLRRLSSGSFSVEDAVKTVRADNDNGSITDKIIPLNEAIPDIREFIIGEELSKRIKNGYRPKWDEITGSTALNAMTPGVLKLAHKSSLVAVIELNNLDKQKDQWIKKMRVFN